MLDMDFEKKINFIIFKIHSAKKKALAEPEPPKFRLDANGEPIEVEETVSSSSDSSKKRIDPQTILISATLTNGIKEIARRLNVVDPVHVDEPSSSSMCAAKKSLESNGTTTRSSSDTSTQRDSNDNSEEIVLPARLSHFYTIVPSKLRLVSLIAFILDKFIVRKCFQSHSFFLFY